MAFASTKRSLEYFTNFKRCFIACNQQSAKPKIFYLHEEFHWFTAFKLMQRNFNFKKILCEAKIKIFALSKYFRTLPSIFAARIVNSAIKWILMKPFQEFPEDHANVQKFNERYGGKLLNLGREKMWIHETLNRNYTKSQKFDLKEFN